MRRPPNSPARRSAVATTTGHPAVAARTWLALATLGVAAALVAGCADRGGDGRRMDPEAAAPQATRAAPGGPGAGTGASGAGVPGTPGAAAGGTGRSGGTGAAGNIDTGTPVTPSRTPGASSTTR